MSEVQTLDAELLRRYPLPHHPADSDKNDRGLALLIAGSRELVGAALLAGIGALRAGAGKLRIATVQSVAIGVGTTVPEAMVVSFPEAEDGSLDPAGIEALVKTCKSADSVTIGPGMQHGPALATLIESAIGADAPYPVVLDAAALGVIRPIAGRLKERGRLILLPHSGEMCRLLDCDEEEVSSDPLGAARRAAEHYGAVTLIKGDRSFIVAPDGPSFCFKGGGIGQATSGSGDTLAGIVGGLAARGADPLTATLWGVYLHGEAGRLLAKEVGKIGYLAREILDRVPRLLESV